jgi:hypothetical protein
MFLLKESGTVVNMFQFSDNTFPLYCLEWGADRLKSRNNPPGLRACQIQMSENVHPDIQEVRTEKAFLGKMLEASNVAYLS